MRHVRRIRPWPIFNFGRLPKKLAIDQARRRSLYELFEDVLKFPTLFKGPTTILSPRHIPLLLLRAVRVLAREGVGGLKRRLASKIHAGYEYLEWIERYDNLSDADRGAITKHIEALSYRPVISVIMSTESGTSSGTSWVRPRIGHFDHAQSRRVHDSSQQCERF